MVVKEMYFEDIECAEWFLRNHASNVYVMDIRSGKNPNHLQITIDTEHNTPNVLVGFAGLMRRRIL